MSDAEIRKVFARWAGQETQHRERLIHTEPMFTANSVPGPADRPVPTYQMRDWRHARFIFAVRFKRRDYFPAFQFDSGRPKAVVGRVLKLLNLVRPIDNWYVMYWFFSANAWLDDGASPVDTMEKNQRAVIEAAFHANDQISD